MKRALLILALSLYLGGLTGCEQTPAPPALPVFCRAAAGLRQHMPDIEVEIAVRVRVEKPKKRESPPEVQGAAGGDPFLCFDDKERTISA